MDIAALTVKQALADLIAKKYNCVELVDSCFTKIDFWEPKIKAFISQKRKLALRQAAESDFRYQNGTSRLLEGIPIAVKDNFNIQGWLTTASSSVLRSYESPYTATVVKRLLDAGAIVVGKTNMDAFAHGSSTETSDFFTTKNPHDVSRLPGGSSGGSAAAVSSGEVLAALGSETAGSIRGPAAWCGVVGLKPTYGLASRYGVVAMASSTDSPGPLAKTVEDTAIFLNVIAGNDPYDATSVQRREPDYTVSLKDSPNSLVVGVPKEYLQLELEPGTRSSFEQALKKLKKIGVTVKEISLLDPKYAVAVYTVLQRSEVSSNLARLDGIRYGNNRQFFGQEAKRRIMLGTYTLSAGYYDAYYDKAQRVRTLIVEDYRKAFEQVDLIVAPTLPCAAQPIGSSEGKAMYGELSDILVAASSIVGLPGISIPCGYDGNLPVGLQIVGPMMSELKIIKLASRLEAELGLKVGASF